MNIRAILVRLFIGAVFGLAVAACGNGGSNSGAPTPPPSATGLKRVGHIIVMMQENHSFDNYFGALPYAPKTPYHAGPCTAADSKCVNGLTCAVSASGVYSCTNFDPEIDGSVAVTAFHDPRLCVFPDLDHTWVGAHREASYNDPDNSINGSNDGFISQNDMTEQSDSNTGESLTDDDTMGFYTQTDLPYYYALAEKFAIDDSYFSSLLGQTVPNRMYEFAATSFGHLVTSTGEAIPPPGGYKPINGTIFDLLDKNNVSWAEYLEAGGVTELGIPYGGLFRTPVPPHFLVLDQFMSQAKSGKLPAVAFVDLGLPDSEHPPFDIRAGEAEVASVINAVRSGPNWKDSIIFLTYDEHGGFYDHVTPPAAVAPDNIFPGQCADLSNPPTSETPGNGAQCSDSLQQAQMLCALALPGETCPGFTQYGFRVPFVAISPFSKTSYVSHTVGDHTSILALIEARFTPGQHLTNRDGAANDLEDLFNFNTSPSLKTNVPPSLAPSANSSDTGCLIQSALAPGT
ncbi:MAG: phospholipase C [Candidatus Binataceae bacterium]